jgi:hypothetical protein
MDFNDDRNAPVQSAGTYSQLSDAQLRSAIRFAQAHLRSVEDDQEPVRNIYREEVAIMRSEPLDRLLARIVMRARPLSDQQLDELHRRFESQALPTAQVTAVVRAAPRGRTDRLDALSEIEAMGILLRLELGP